MIAALLLAGAFELVDVPCGKGSHEPQLSVANDGRVALAWGNEESIHCCVGAPGKNEEFQRDQLVAKGLQFSVGMRRGPRVALLEGERVVVSAIGGAKGGGKDGDLFAWRSLPDAKGWSAAVRINSVEGTAREGLHAMARGPKGELYCTWIDLREKKPALFGALSTDGGTTWTLEQRISRDPELCPCCAPSACYDLKGGLHLMWRGLREGARDMLLAHSSDGGKSFGEATKIGSGTWKIDACPMDGGAIAALTDGAVLAVYRREKELYSSRGEKAESRLGKGEQAWVCGTEIGIWVVWLEKRGGKLLTHPFGGREDVELDSQANDPVVASSPDGMTAYAAWERSSGGLIRLARLRNEH